MDPRRYSPIEPTYASNDQWQQEMDHPSASAQMDVLEHQQERPLPSGSMSFVNALIMPHLGQQQLISDRLVSSSSLSSSSSAMPSVACRTSDPPAPGNTVSTPVDSSIIPSQLKSPSSLSSFNQAHDYDTGPRKRRPYDRSGIESMSNTTAVKTRHYFSTKQDKFLADKLLESPMHELLQSCRERGQAAPSKESLHQEIAMEFNQRFKTSVDGPQIKNKIAHMRKRWCTVHDTMSRIDPEDKASRKMIMDKYPIYQILEPISDIMLSTVSRKDVDDGNNGDDSVESTLSDMDDEAPEQRLNADSTPSGSVEPGPSLKRCGMEHERERGPERNTKRPGFSGPNVSNFLTDVENTVRQQQQQQQQQQQRQQWMTSNERYRAEYDIEVMRGQIAFLIEAEATKRAELRLEYGLSIDRARIRQLELELDLEREKVKRLTLERDSFLL
ncbi:MAG: hypothetical protein J3Q66DRAFT_365061 [Benniella sp.]|nr:MAG: hypothetical protein J3Q66DRAFT_365061 [Benniella sp.]